MKKLYVTLALSIVTSFLFLKVKGQVISAFAGTGVLGYSGDGSWALNAKFDYPDGISVDASGNVYISDYFNNVIRKVNTSGIISTFAGTGSPSYGGDGGPATSAQLKNPNAVTVDATGNVFICDYGNNVIRKVNTSGIISTVAGTQGFGGFSGDGGNATSAQLKYPFAVAVDVLGNIYIADQGNYRIRKVNTSGIISTIAGTGITGYSGDGGPATSAQLNGPYGIALDALGNLFLTDFGNNCVRKINTSGIISTIAGTGVGGFSGDGGPATLAQLNSPYGIAIDASGNMYISEYGNNDRIRKINTSGTISTFAGTGVPGSSGDGGLAINAKLDNPTGIAVDGVGNLIIADQSNYRVRKVTLTTNVKQVLINDVHYSIFPNPNNGTFKLLVESEINSGELILINSIGQKAHGEKILQGSNDIETKNLSRGIYRYILLENKMQLSNGNLIIE